VANVIAVCLAVGASGISFSRPIRSVAGERSLVGQRLNTPGLDGVQAVVFVLSPTLRSGFQLIHHAIGAAYEYHSIKKSERKISQLQKI